MSKPIRHMRVTFWGTQGSVQYFPGPDAIERYSERIAVDAVRRVLADVLRRAEASPDGRLSIDEILDGARGDGVAEKYLQKLGREKPAVYGGETTCAEIEDADGNVFVIDGGSGIRHFAKNRIAQWVGRTDRTISVLGTHDHLDHRIGLPFCEVCFIKPHPFHLNVYGNNRFLSALDDRFGVFSKKITKWTYLDDPLDYRMMSATFAAVELRNSANMDPQAKETPPWQVHDITEPLRIGRMVITPLEVYHVETPCLA
ncbi:MAG: hypothetical protein KY476_21885 [Planctomycetes bacterium]|nr:hypothetical protein [Planctomycetota bacterium]